MADHSLAFKPARARALRRTGIAMTYKQLADGTVVEVLPDGGSKPVPTRTDWDRLARLSDDEIEELAASDPDHPALDDRFWGDAAKQARTVVRLEPDVAAQFGGEEHDLDRRVNAILRDHFRAKRAAS
ncbi:hypothetical protein [Enterovirga aerilata]|uniref:Uncharacterized protein n=1 Tax=Enterovirga aerilata TaxID=2730920 RepID=A0A849I9C5_9HYPH|nr:hypothetical protein [Enterovirga sp. DB1703]NNM72885.1 hypothetical protein [Enterovirga sp. DB1703]